IEAIVGPGDGLRVSMDIDPKLPPEGYSLEVASDSIVLRGADPDGLFYAGQTLLQILAFEEKEIELRKITDWPRYKTRELMVDMGRSVYSMSLLKRVVRIMARLKLNSLHLHLYDDEANSLRFDNLPLGSENTWAISIGQLRQLVAYANQYHVTVVPELECWGHAGSILHHYPELYGAPGMWGGYSFGIGEEFYSLIEKILDEVVPVLDEECSVHLGLDEANWAILPSAKNAPEGTYTPEKLVGRLYDILQKVGKRHSRKPHMRIWADHGGRPIPQEIRRKVITEPWQYFRHKEQDIKDKVAKFGAAGEPQFMMGAGMSSSHLQGAYEATRIWCREAAKVPNVEGVDICMWESNDVASHLIGIYAGAACAWSPDSFEPAEEDTYGEQLHGRLLAKMKRWQNIFTDAADKSIRMDMGEEAYRGFFVSGPLAGKPVSPNALREKPVFFKA
ncbi:MAG TPA: family 20 glycosylhydrolase, partial [Armatimonadota bacterium]